MSQAKSEYSFRFLDARLNRKLISLFKQERVPHRVDDDGVIHFSSGDEEVVENDLIGPLRASVFPDWQVLTCPGDWTNRYKAYMVSHKIRFTEELADGQLWFLIPGNVKPHFWDLPPGLQSVPGDGKGGAKGRQNGSKRKVPRTAVVRDGRGNGS